MVYETLKFITCEFTAQISSVLACFATRGCGRGMCTRKPWTFFILGHQNTCQMMLQTGQHGRDNGNKTQRNQFVSVMPDKVHQNDSSRSRGASNDNLTNKVDVNRRATRMKARVGQIDGNHFT